MSKECPENKILNPKTNRCVLKTSKIGMSILSNTKECPENKTNECIKSNTKECPENKVLNPKTNRCVLKTSKIGMSILSNTKDKAFKSSLTRELDAQLEAAKISYAETKKKYDNAQKEIEEKLSKLKYYKNPKKKSKNRV